MKYVKRLESVIHWPQNAVRNKKIKENTKSKRQLLYWSWGTPLAHISLHPSHPTLLPPPTLRPTKSHCMAVEVERATNRTLNGGEFESVFYVPVCSFRYLTVSSWFLISKFCGLGEQGSAPPPHQCGKVFLSHHSPPPNQFPPIPSRPFLPTLSFP